MKALNFKVRENDRIIIQEIDKGIHWNFSHGEDLIEHIRSTSLMDRNVIALFIIKPKKQTK